MGSVESWETLLEKKEKGRGKSGDLYRLRILSVSSMQWTIKLYPVTDGKKDQTASGCDEKYIVKGANEQMKSPVD